MKAIQRQAFTTHPPPSVTLTPQRQQHSQTEQKPEKKKHKKNNKKKTKQNTKTLTLQRQRIDGFRLSC